MSALAEAIRRARPRGDLTDASPFGGLHRRHARTIDVVAQSVAAIAPAGVLLVHPSGLYARSGSFAFLDIVLTIVIVAAVAAVIGLFARRISSTGSLYTFTSRGLGPVAGTLAGAALAVGYLSVGLSTLVSGSTRIARVVAPGPEAVPSTAIAVTVIAAAASALVIARGLRLSTRLLLVLEAIAMVVALGLSLYALTVSGWDLQLLVPDVGAIDPSVIAAGVSFAIIGFVGFESGAALGPETRRPFAAVPRGVLLSVGAVAVVLLLGTAAQLSLVAEDADAPTLGSVLGAERAVDLLVGVSFLACALAMTNATTRLVFALAREGLLPSFFGRTSRRGVPAAAGVVLMTLLAVVAVTVQATGLTPMFRQFTGPGSTIGFFVAYALTCVAAVVFLARLGELTVRSAVVAIVPALALGALLVTYVGGQLGVNGWGVAAAVLAIGGVAAAGILRLSRIPRTERRPGVHDWPVADQTIGGVFDARRD